MGDQVLFLTTRVTIANPAGANFGPDDRLLTRQEITALAGLYFPQDQVTNAVNVANLESGWRTGAWNADGEDSRGLWQINVVDAAHPEMAKWNLFDPQINAYFAGRIYAAAGNWRDWLNSAIRLGLPH